MHPHVQQTSPHPASSHHSYGTRIRKNSILKPSSRLRQSPPPPVPRRIKPVPVPAAHHPVALTPDPYLPVFPLPGVMLHPEDASNKVFHAIGRSFLSVENRAMTIKDLAEMTLNYGLMCQNVSAASQAITTYIRNHMARCEAQQDHPLLLRHVLSGTLSDDDLVPALYSRQGGATNPTKLNSKDLGLNDKNVPRATQGMMEGERITNFRRGTMVWYLSKAAGVLCPFARAGIRLCEYGKEGRKIAGKHGDESQPGPKKQSSRDQARCGEKRKRLRRGCRQDSDWSLESSSAGRDSQSPATDSGYGELITDSSDDERPPKVKLTLRLRPSLPCAPTLIVTSRPREVIDLSSDVSGSSFEDDDTGTDDSDGANTSPDLPEAPWGLPPYPRRSISVPSYTPICDERDHSALFSAKRHATSEERKRSPSVPRSASPPPDSDHDDFDLDLDSDIDWDSSSFSVPSPAPTPRTKIETTDDLQPFKYEPADIRDILDAWEDHDCAPTSTVSSATVKLPTTDDLKSGALELWEWEFESSWTGTPEDHQDLPIVKMEPDGRQCLTSPTFAPGSLVSSNSPLTSSHHSSPVSELDRSSHSPLLPPTLPTSPSLSLLLTGINMEGRALAWQDAELLGPDSVHPHEFEDGWTSGKRSHAEYNLLSQPALDEEASSLPIEPKQDQANVACIVVKEIETCHSASKVHPEQSPPVTDPDVVVVHTCRPCSPDICATQIEGITVYQTILGSTLLLRRIDTDFVNLSTILAHLSLPPPSPLLNACVSVSHPLSSIDGIWAPLSVARLYACDLPPGIESVFLSDDLVLCFPTALQDFYQKSTSGRLLNQFGPPFHATLSLPRAGNAIHMPQIDHGKSAKEDAWEASLEVGLVEEPLLAIPPSVNLALAALHASTSTEVVSALPEMPLSPTEQEIFRALCVHPDWEPEEAGTSGIGGKANTTRRHSPARERPLRRSRRVADAAAAARSRALPRTKGRRHW